MPAPYDSAVPTPELVGSSPRRDLWVLSGLFAALAFLLFFRLGATPVSNGAEHRCSDIIQRMVATGDWLVPRREGGPWFNKPPLYYWMDSVWTTLVGHFDAGVLRVPAAICTLFLAGLVSIWGREVGGRKLALLAPFLFALMLLVHQQGRRGVAEMPLALSANLALLVFYRMDRDRDGRQLPLFALGFCLALLAKATVGVLLVGLPIVLFLLLQRRLRASVSRRVVAWVGTAFALGVVWWPIVLSIEPEALARVWSELALTSAGVKTRVDVTNEHFGAIYQHVLFLFDVGQPTVLLLPVVVVAAWRTRLWREREDLRFLGTVFFGLLIAFSLFPTKRAAYLLPLLPALSILAGHVALEVVARGAAGERRLRRFLTVVAGLFAVALAVVSWLWLGAVLGLGAIRWVPVAAAALALGGLASRSAARGRWGLFCASFGLAWGILLLINFSSLEVWKRQFRVGSAVLRPDFNEPRWAEIKERYPQVARGFRVDDSWVARYFGSPPEVQLVRTGTGAARMPTVPPWDRPESTE